MGNKISLKIFASVLLLALMPGHSQAQEENEQQHKLGELLYCDRFNSGLNNWVVEKSSETDSVVVADNSLVIDVNGGTTVWFNKKITGNVYIEYKRKVVMANEKNDRLSDLNTFWMANDPARKNLFTRSGNFQEYDSLLLYYVGIGGNTNSTTRFRKYDGKGDRKLLAEYLDADHLLQPNKEYTVGITVYDGKTRFSVDGTEYFSLTDPEPIKEGYFGFRTVHSRQAIQDFRVYRLK
jgi:rhamnogalacturonan endolyase